MVSICTTKSTAHPEQDSLEKEVANCKEEANASMLEIKSAVRDIRDRLENVEEGEEFVLILQVQSYPS